MNSNDDELVEDTEHEYWARGQSGHGQNMLGQLLMVIREGLNTKQSTNSSADYRPPANGITAPYFKCGEGNHNSTTCRHDGFLQCRK